MYRGLEALEKEAFRREERNCSGGKIRHLKYSEHIGRDKDLR